ncbi:MAG: sel1 repeat family protein [Deltaproteobacteria bacterium]|nr:sel1 repeat family protein [Deltaproteobacteria bacterium]
MYYRPHSLKIAIEPELNINVCKKQDELGYTEFQYEYGRYFLFGLSVTQNFSTFRQWFQIAVEQGHVPSQYKMYLFYLKGGGGVSRDLAMSPMWLRKAAEQGMPLAKEQLRSFIRESGKSEA